MIELAPSLLAADWMHLGREIENMLNHGVNLLHFDVMDAHFVPNLSFGPDLCSDVHRLFPECRLDVHLMMDNPQSYWRIFAEAGAETITLHREVLADPRTAMKALRSLGVRRGMAVKPGTPAEELLPYLDCLDHILIMTVEPGFGGQTFMPEQMDKVRMLRDKGFTGDIAVDGGINLDTARVAVQAGANVLVMGTSYFHSDDPGRVARAVKELK